MAELIKLAPVIRELQKRNIAFTILVSGQTDVRFEEFKSYFARPNIIHAVTPKTRESSIPKFIFWATRTFFSLLLGLRSSFKGLDKSNSLFIVHGDTVSSLMGSLVATLYGLKLVHIESGLRSFNFFEPFPEEICRFIISRLADIHFCPNAWSVGNLKSVKGEKIDTLQNTLFDSYRWAMKRKNDHPFVLRLRKQKKRYFVLVIHRQEHVVFGKTRTKEMIMFILKYMPNDMMCVFLVHDLSMNFIRSLGPVITKKTMRNLIKVKRLPYEDFMHLLERAEFFVTDGGSNQEEMYYMGKPCLILRNNVERVEGLGTNAVLSYGKENTIKDFFNNYKKYRREALPFTGSPSKIIVDYLVRA